MITTTIYQSLMLIAIYFPSAIESKALGRREQLMKVDIAFCLGMIGTLITNISYGLVGNLFSILAEIITFLCFFYIAKIYWKTIR